MTDTVWVGAFRYYLGRRTYAVSDFVRDLIAAWPTLPASVKTLIQRELDDAFDDDRETRINGRMAYRLGHDCDKAEWEKVRALYQERKK